MTEFLSHPVPAVIIMLGILVFVHEAGHYLVGRWCGIAVETFSIGFGAPIVRFRRKGVDYRISWIPLGGYVKFVGAHPSEDLPAELNGVPYREAATWKRALTIFAGPLANFLLAVGAYATLGFSGIQHPPALIGEVIEGSAAAQAGIKYGDRIIAIEGKPIANWRDMEQIISSSPGKELTITIERERLKEQVEGQASGKEILIKLTPAPVETTDLAGRAVSIGRAGIARGSLPAVVSIESASSPAALAGLQTGDQITQLRFGDESRTIKTYPDLIAAIEDVYAEEHLEQVQVTATQASVPGENATATTGGRDLVLDIRGIRDGVGERSGRDLLRQLGIRDSQLTVAEATETAAGVLHKADILTHWKGMPLKDIYHLSELLMANSQQIVPISVIRDAKALSLDLSLKAVEAQMPEGVKTLYTMPVVFWGQPQEPEPVLERYGAPGAFAYGIRETWHQTATLFDNVKSLVTGEVPLKALGGPMLIAKVAGESAKRGWQTFLGAMALISINLGLLNLFPIPVLDGGQLLLIGAEAVKRRPLRERAVENFQKVGFAMILALVVLATYNDLSRFWKSMLASVAGMFQ